MVLNLGRGLPAVRSGFSPTMELESQDSGTFTSTTGDVEALESSTRHQAVNTTLNLVLYEVVADFSLKGDTSSYNACRL